MNNKSLNKRKKILRDNIQGITKPALRRLGYTAGVKQMSEISYEELRGMLKQKLENVIYKAVVYLDHYRKRTIDEYIISSVISPKLWSDDPKTASCKRPDKKTPTESAKRRRHKKGMKALQEIRFYQKRSECLNIPRASFSRYVREVTQDFKTYARFSSKAFIILQYSMENYIVDLLKKSQLVAIHAKRITVEPKDINFASKI